MKKNNTWISFTFEWNSLIKDLIRCSWAIVLAAIIAWMGIHVYETSVYTPTYVSSAVLVVRSKVGISGAYSNLTASAEMAKIFTKVFKQNSMKKLAAENLGLDSFDGTIETSVKGSTNMLNISVKADEPELAFQLLTSILEVYPKVSDAVFTDAVINIISEPQMPSYPANSALITYRKHIILLAMAFEAAIVILLSLLRETVKEEKGFSGKIDSKLLGIVPHERPHLSFKEILQKKKRALLINDPYSSLKFTEDYQKLATKLEYINKNNGKKVITITSVAENEGKSTVAANLAIALSNRGYKIALLDLDVHKPSLYKIFDFYDEIKNDFSDVLSSKIGIGNFRFFRYRKSDLLIAFNKKTYSNSAELFKGHYFEDCILTLREQMDFVIIDTPPTSVSADAITLSTYSDSTLIVVRTDCVPVRDINDTILSIADAGGNLEGCILNNVYKPFTLFGQMGADERGGYGYGNYYGYSKYSKSSSLTEVLDEGFSADLLDDMNSKKED
ncbi:MAG: P-loop NTPase [Clostridia bacterium]|nr:P-loop NTPase [Clostridia bacterium]